MYQNDSDLLGFLKWVLCVVLIMTTTFIILI